MAKRRVIRMALAGLGLSLGVFAAPFAAAEPVLPVDPAAPVTHSAASPTGDAVPPGPPASVAATSSTLPDGVSHLPSPDALPPGTTQTAPEHPKLGYLRDIWQAIRGRDISASDALLLLAQRPVDESKLAGSVPSNQERPTAAEVPTTAATPEPAAAESAGSAAAQPAPTAKTGEAPTAPVTPAASESEDVPGS